jgi:hypothetical protein
MSALLRCPVDETERLIEAMLESHREAPPGVLVGNADIATPAKWTPYAGPRERAPLPGCEHLQGADLDLIGGAK